MKAEEDAKRELTKGINWKGRTGSFDSINEEKRR